MRISDWSSDVCSSGLHDLVRRPQAGDPRLAGALARRGRTAAQADHLGLVLQPIPDVGADIELVVEDAGPAGPVAVNRVLAPDAATGTARAVLVEAGGDRLAGLALEIGRAHDCTPVTIAQLVCRLLLNN